MAHRQNGRVASPDPGADPLVEFVKLEIDGQEYLLAYDFGAIAEAEGIVNKGRNPDEERCNLLRASFAVLVTALDARELRGLLYAALRKAQPRMTMQQVSALCRLDTIARIHDALQRAWSASMPENKRGDPPAAGGEATPAA